MRRRALAFAPLGGLGARENPMPFGSEPRRRPQLRLFFALGLGLIEVACTREVIPNTDVEDNDFNRGVVEFCEDYRHAVERRNVAHLLKLADPKYYEDGGSVDTSDDLDYTGLKAYLEGKFRDVKAIRYEVRYREVSRGRNEEVFVDYTYSASYKIPTPKGDVWRRRVSDNRLELKLEDKGGYKILAGM
jgi:hypothetical protein